MHVVHYRRDISPLELDGRYNTGIRVIGVFFRVRMETNILLNASYIELIIYKPRS